MVAADCGYRFSAGERCVVNSQKFQLSPTRHCRIPPQLPHRKEKDWGTLQDCQNFFSQITLVQIRIWDFEAKKG
jgi:hypothetical protein